MSARDKLSGALGNPRPMSAAEKAIVEKHFEDPTNQAAADFASEDDRLWFEDHPGESTRHRPAIPGELPGMRPLPAAEGMDVERYIEVTQVEPGFRLRRSYAVFSPATEASESE
jgi:hypothetical protein